MPTYAGQKLSIETAQAQDVYTSSNLFIAREYLIPGPNKTAVELGDGLKFSPLDSTGVIDPHMSTYAGAKTADFGTDWYYRIHIIPAQLSLGNLLTTQNRLVTLWNANFVSKPLTLAEIPPVAGLSLSLPTGVTLPYTVKPLEEFRLTVVATLDGPPTVNGVMNLTVDAVSYSIPITGRRIVLFPFRPNWSSGYDETFEYKAWVLPAADGSEQSGSVWGNRPRRKLDYTILVNGKQTQKLENLLFGWQSRFFGVPHWSEVSKLTANASANALVIQLDTTLRSFEPGALIVIHLNDDVFESREIESLTATSITLTTPLGTAWPVGSRVYPTFVASINGSLSGRRLTDNIMQMPVSFECEPSVTPAITAIGGATPMYQGEELYLAKLNWAGLSTAFVSDREDIDMGTGRVKLYSPSGFTRPTRTHNWHMKSRAETSDFLAWVGRREGRARPFYAPTWNEDFKLIADIVNPASGIDVEENEYAPLVALRPARRDIVVLARDGTYHARRITGTAATTGGVRLLLDSPITTTLPRSAVKRVCLLQLYRQAADDITIRWLTDKVGTAEVQLMSKRPGA